MLHWLFSLLCPTLSLPLLLLLEITSQIIYIHPSPHLWLYFGAVQTQILLPFSDLDISCVPVKQNYFWFINYTMLLACVWNFSSGWNDSHSGQRIIHPSRLISKTTKHHLLWKTSSVFYPNLYRPIPPYTYVCVRVYTYIHIYLHTYISFYHFISLFSQRVCKLEGLAISSSSLYPPLHPRNVCLNAGIR